MGGIDGTSCRQHQVMMTQLLQKTLGVARGQKANEETRQLETSHYVLGQYGHQDGLRRGKTEAHRENHGAS